jgi:DNA polymerase III alpha subunit (gram-positive type)
MNPGDRVVVFDVETGGLDPYRHPVIQFAAVACDGEWSEVEAVEVKVAFEETLADAEALALNHYDPSVWAREAVAGPIARGKIADFLRRHATVEKTSRGGKTYRVARLCGHNSRFDAEFLAAWFKSAGEFLPAACFEALCTLNLARWLTLGTSAPPVDHKLGSLCSWAGIAADNAHDALADVRATAELARRLMSRIEVPS